MEFLIRKAWELGEKTAHYDVEVILKAPGREFCAPASRPSLSGQLENRQENAQARFGVSGKDLVLTEKIKVL
jgi:hypothetical protein